MRKKKLGESCYSEVHLGVNEHPHSKTQLTLDTLTNKHKHLIVSDRQRD
jgi:hypothetical protein